MYVSLKDVRRMTYLVPVYNVFITMASILLFNRMVVNSGTRLSEHFVWINGSDLTEQEQCECFLPSTIIYVAYGVSICLFIYLYVSLLMFEDTVVTELSPITDFRAWIYLINVK